MLAPDLCYKSSRIRFTIQLYVAVLAMEPRSGRGPSARGPREDVGRGATTAAATTATAAATTTATAPAGATAAAATATAVPPAVDITTEVSW